MINQEVNELKQRIDALKLDYFSKMGRKQQLQEHSDKLQKTLQNLLENLELLENVKILLQKTSQITREQSKARIEEIVTNCLQFIFESNIRFSIEMNEVRGKQEAEFYVISDFEEKTFKTKPQEARGGGVVDIISLAIRIAMLQSNSDQIQGPIILDEPAKHVSDDYIIKVAEFLKQVSKIFKRQVIMVTHNKYLAEIADKSFKVELQGNTSIVM